MHEITSSTDSIEIEASLYFVGIYTAKETVWKLHLCYL